MRPRLSEGGPGSRTPRPAARGSSSAGTDGGQVASPGLSTRLPCAGNASVRGCVPRAAGRSPDSSVSCPGNVAGATSPRAARLSVRGNSRIGCDRVSLHPLQACLPPLTALGKVLEIGKARGLVIVRLTPGILLLRACAGVRCGEQACPRSAAGQRLAITNRDWPASRRALMLRLPEVGRTRA